MQKAPIISTIIALGLLPVAFLYIHSYIGSIKKWKYHHITGISAILLDLIISIGYMIYRSFGGKVNGSSINLTGPILAYFIAHGIISLVVIFLEIAVLVCYVYYAKNKSMPKSYSFLWRTLFITWWFAFLSGEIVYIVYYLL